MQQRPLESERISPVSHYGHIPRETDTNIVEVHTFPFDGTKNTGPDAVDRTLAPPAEIKKGGSQDFQHMKSFQG